MCSAVALGCLWHQLTFVVHDAGHTGITGKAGWDKLIGIVVSDELSDAFGHDGAQKDEDSFVHENHSML